MTVKELIRELQNVPEDAIVLTNHHYHGLYEVVEAVEYNNPQNVVYFWGNEIYGSEDYEDNIPDDVDETNYNPYCGCDMFEICGSIDEEW